MDLRAVPAMQSSPQVYDIFRDDRRNSGHQAPAGLVIVVPPECCRVARLSDRGDGPTRI